jgi:hypothetical protein
MNCNVACSLRLIKVVSDMPSRPLVNIYYAEYVKCFMSENMEQQKYKHVVASQQQTENVFTIFSN